MKAFKITLISILSVVGLSLLIGSIFFVKDYIDKNTKYKEYKLKVEKTTKQNDELILSNKTLLEQNSQYENDKIDLQKKIDEKKVVIVEKEKIVYKDGQLIVPQDYDTLKFNYSTLSVLYTDRGTIIEQLEGKNKISEKQVVDLTNALSTTNTRLEIANNLLKNPVEKPIQFIKQGILMGVGIKINGTITYSGAYLLTIKDKLYAEGILTYPAQAQVLIGVKF